jgi:hypothetical protein
MVPHMAMSCNAATVTVLAMLLLLFQPRIEQYASQANAAGS